MWLTKFFIVTQLLSVGLFGMSVTNPTCPQFGTFYGYDLSHSGCCLDESNCMISEATLTRQLKKENGLLGQESDQRFKRKRNAEAVLPRYLTLPSYYTLCRSNVSVIQPMYGTTTFSPYTRVQILQVPPLLTQDVVVEYCEEQDTPLIRGYCKQHYKWESLHTVKGNGTDGEVLLRKEWILIPSGCDLVFDVDIEKLLNSTYLIPNRLGQLSLPSSHNYVQEFQASGQQPYINEQSSESQVSESPYPSTTTITYPSDDQGTDQFTTQSTTIVETTSYPVPTPVETTITTTTALPTVNYSSTVQGNYSGRTHDDVPDPYSESGPNVHHVIYSPSSEEPREFGTTAAPYSSGKTRKYYGPIGPHQIRSVNQKHYFAGGEREQSQNSTSESRGAVYGKPYRRVYQVPHKIGMPVYSMTDNPDRIRSLKSRP